MTRARPATVKIQDVDESRDSVPIRGALSSYGADYPVDGLVSRLTSGDIVIPTFDPQSEAEIQTEGFQRGFVWKKKQCDRFVESLLLGFPVPGIFLFKQDDGRLLVLDGQQRLRTIAAFYEGRLKGKPFELENVQRELKSLTFESLSASQRRRLADSVIHATIIRQDAPGAPISGIYHIFERLNTGGTPLQPQEIRAALYHGGLLALIRELNENADWRSLIGAKSPRHKDQELILRFFAMKHQRGSYARPMKDFLNLYLDQNDSARPQRLRKLGDEFRAVVAALSASIGRTALRLERTVNAAFADSVMVGLSLRLDARPISPARIKSAIESLTSNAHFLTAVKRATSDEESVKVRMDLAIKAFGK